MIQSIKFGYCTFKKNKQVDSQERCQEKFFYLYLGNDKSSSLEVHRITESENN